MASTGTIIPLYTVPTDPSWTEVALAKAAHPNVPVIAVIDPANGPGAAVQPDYTSGIAGLIANGVKVVGYVHTSYGARAPADVQADVDRWHAFYPQVTGIFFDEQSNTMGLEGYYKDLTSYVKSHGFDFTVGNPGQDTKPTFVGTVDTVLIYEGAGLPAVTDLGGWHGSYDRRSFGIIPYGVPAVDAAFIRSARDRVAYIYMQSDVMPNPWDSVPGYLNTLLDALNAP